MWNEDTFQWLVLMFLCETLLCGLQGRQNIWTAKIYQWYFTLECLIKDLQPKHLLTVNQTLICVSPSAPWRELERLKITLLNWFPQNKYLGLLVVKMPIYCYEVLVICLPHITWQESSNVLQSARCITSVFLAVKRHFVDSMLNITTILRTTVW